MTGRYCDPLRLLDNGWHVIPLRPGSKRPAIAGWHRLALLPPPEAQVARWAAAFPDAGWGIACGLCAVAVDDDCDTPPASALLEATRLAVLGETPAVRTGKPGRSLALYCPADAIRYANLSCVGCEIHGLNSDGETGRQVAAFGPHPSAPGGRYTWPVEDLHGLRPRDLPPVSAEDMARFAAALKVAFASAGLTRPEVLRQGAPGAVDRNAARAIRLAGRAGPAAALAEARRVLEAAAVARQAGA